MKNIIGASALVLMMGLTAFIFYMKSNNPTPIIASSLPVASNLQEPEDIQASNTIEISSNKDTAVHTISSNHSTLTEPQVQVSNSNLQQILRKIESLQKNSETENIDEIIARIAEIDSTDELFALQDFALQNMLYANSENEQIIKQAIRKRIEVSNNADDLGFQLSTLLSERKLNQEQQNQLLKLNLPFLHSSVFIDSYNTSDIDTFNAVSSAIESNHNMEVGDFISLSHKIDSEDYQQKLKTTFSNWLDKNNEDNIIAIEKMISVGDIEDADRTFLESVVNDLKSKKSV